MTLLMSGSVLKKQMEVAGFENVTVREFKLPIGTWAADAKMKEMGGFQLVAMLEGIHGLTVDFWVNCLGWSIEEVSQPFFVSSVPEFSWAPLYRLSVQEQQTTLTRIPG